MAATSKKQKNKWRPFGIKKRYIALVLLACLIAGTAFVLLHIEDIAEDRLLRVINAELAPNAEIEFGDFSFSRVPAGLVIRDIKLVHHIPFVEHTPEKSADAVRRFEVGRLEFSGINLFRMIVTRQWRLDNIVIDNLTFELVPAGDGRLADAAPFRQPPPFVIASITVNNSSFSIYRGRDHSEPSYEINNIHAGLNNFSVADINAPFHTYFDDLVFNSAAFTYHTQDGHYSIGADTVSVDSSRQFVYAGNGFVKPHLTANEMAQKTGKQTDRFEISFERFSSDHINVRSWIEENELYTRFLLLEKPSIVITRDKSYPRETRTDRSLPMEHLKNLPFRVMADSIRIDGGYLSYTEDFPTESRKGFIDFRDIDFRIDKLQNMDPEDSVHVFIRSRFLDLAELHLEGHFSLNDQADHTIKGSMAGFDMKQLNRHLEQWLFVRVGEGEMQHADFYFSANNERANGEIRFLYNNLRIRFLDEATLEETRRRRLRSFFANRFAVRSANPSHNPRTGTIEFERDKERSAFNYWWKSIASGLKDTVRR